MRIMAGPLCIFSAKNLKKCKQTQLENEKKIEKQAQKNVFKSRILTFVVSHRLGLHGEGSHYQTHVDFCLQASCVGKCELVRACV